MRLNIRYKDARCSIEVDGGVMKLCDLKSQLKQELNISSIIPVELSLNGSDPLMADDDLDEDVSLSDAGLVSGDLLYVLVSSNQSAHSSQSPQAPIGQSSQPMDVSCENPSSCTGSTAAATAAATAATRCAASATKAAADASATVPNTTAAAATNGCATTAINAAATSATTEAVVAASTSKAATSTAAAANSASPAGILAAASSTAAAVSTSPEDITAVVCTSSAQSMSSGGGGEERMDESQASGGVEEGEGVEVETNRYLREPTLLREAGEDVLPQSLERACSELRPACVWEYLCVALHVLMTELGFQPEVFDEREGGGTEYVWRVRGGVRFEYRPRQCREARCSLICSPIKSVLVVYGSIQVDNESCHKTKLQIKFYDYINRTDDARCDQLMFRCDQLSRLSREFKDKVATPLLHFALAECGQTSMGTLTTLPNELQMKILGKLDIVSVVRLSETCHVMRSVCQEQSVWRQLYIKDFGRRENQAFSQNWHLLYREMYIFTKETQTRRSAPRPGPYGPLPTLPPVPFSPYLPGFIIGGDYDLNPSFFNPFSSRDPLRIFRPMPGAPRPYPPSAFDPSLHFDETGELPPLHPSSSAEALGGGRQNNIPGGPSGLPNLGRHPLTSGLPHFR